MILLTKNPFAYTVWLMEETNITAFAKINIGLTIFDRRKSGYHDIESLFQNVDIADSLRIRPNNVGKIVIEGDIGCAPEQSTIYHAAKHFCMEFEDKSPITGVTIKVEKGIPSGAGLGGAGADAAATLFGMNELFEKRLSRAELARIGSRVASDVAFFLYGGAAIVRGRGEYVFPIEPRTDFGLVILQPTWASSTREAYAALDNYRAMRGIEHACTSEDAAGYSINLPNEQLEKIYRSPIQKWGFGKRFSAYSRRKEKAIFRNAVAPARSRSGLCKSDRVRLMRIWCVRQRRSSTKSLMHMLFLAFRRRGQGAKLRCTHNCRKTACAKHDCKLYSRLQRRYKVRQGAPLLWKLLTSVSGK